MTGRVIVNVSTIVGDDENGDGTQDRPVRTIERAEELSALFDGAPICVNGEVSNDAWDAIERARRETDWQYVACWVVLLAFVAFMCAALAGKVVGL